MKHNKILITICIIMFIFLLTGCIQTEDVNSSVDNSLKGEDFILSLVDCEDAVISAGYFSYAGHKGVDIAAPAGVAIYAAEDGVVKTAVEMNMGYGIHCIISHESCDTLYAHCQSLTVEKGDVVKKGDIIGYVGNTGQSTGPHLHFEVQCDDVNHDPVEWYK